MSSGKCGLSRCITKYLVWMAAGDLMHLIVGALLFEMKETFFPHAFLNITPICRLNMAMIYIAIDGSVWLTVAFTFDRLVAICYQSLRAKYCTEKNATRVITVVCFLCLLQNIPVFFVFEAGEIIDGVAWFCRIRPNFYTSPIWNAYFMSEIILTPVIPFALILVFNVLTIKHIIVANRVRSKLRGNNNENGQADQEIENRRKSIILLLAISFSSILLWLVNFACFVSTFFSDNELMEAGDNGPFTIVEEIGYQLRFLSTCTNTFIYAASQSRFREELKNMMKRPLILINRLHGCRSQNNLCNVK